MADRHGTGARPFQIIPEVLNRPIEFALLFDFICHPEWYEL